MPRAATTRDSLSTERGAPLVVDALDVEAATGHLAAWTDLAARSLEPNPFMEPEFCLPAARHLVPRGAVIFLLVWEETAGAPRRLIAVCPLPRGRLAMRLTSGVWYHDLMVLGAPLLDRESARPALFAVLRWLHRRRLGCAVLMIRALDRAGATARLMEDFAAETGRRLCFLNERRRAVLAAAPGGLAALSRRRSKEVQRQRRRLSELGALTYRSVGDPAAIAGALDGFLLLEAQGWKGSAGTALAQDRARAGFVREMVARMAARGQCRIDTLLLGETTLAMGIVLTLRERHYFWKTAFAEEHAALSPGVQFAIELTRKQQSGPGILSTDSCAIPDHPMIDRLWPERLSVADAMIGTRPGRAAAFAMASVSERAWQSGRSGLKQFHARWRRG